MEIKGKLVLVLPAVTGQGRNGEWKRQEFVIEQEGSFPRKACISTWGDKVNVEELKMGSMLNIFVDVESREFQSKWYTSLTAWKVEVLDDGAGSQASPLQPQQSAESSPFTPTQVYADDSSEEEPKDDLPF